MEQRFDVQGMSCDHCVKAVTAALRRVDPAARVDVDLAGGRVVVDAAAPRERLAQAIRDEGYGVAG